MILEFFSVTDTGRARRNNEDSVALDEPGRIAVLADGMGGYNAGEVASGMASERVKNELLQRLKPLGAAAGEADSLLQEQIDAGLITAEQAAYSMHKNLVTRAVGVDELVDLEIHDYPVEPGDLLLMCSDGLSDMLTDEQIEQLLRTNDSLPAAGAMLVQAANAAGGRDNIAVILARAKPGTRDFAKSWWSFWR
jgi:serine/threonine protein phosphatase PrpC